MEQLKELDYQELFYKDNKNYDVWLTRGIIFDMDDGLEISLEKDIWFSENIYVDQGYNLIEKYANTNDFENDWDSTYTAKASRRIVEINAK